MLLKPYASRGAMRKDDDDDDVIERCSKRVS